MDFYIKSINEYNGEIDIDGMYAYIEKYARHRGMEQTLKALTYAKIQHEGQFRKGPSKIPYIYHPLMVACHGMALGFDEDNIVATALLHDVCEDCGRTKEELPVSEQVQDAVELLTKDINLYSKDINAESKYYNRIATNRIACIVKLLDRCNNISDMVDAFSKEKMIDYIESTLYYVYPLFDVINKEYSDDFMKVKAIKYHMDSIIKNIRILTK